jgi:hypothetical protein
VPTLAFCGVAAWRVGAVASRVGAVASRVGAVVLLGVADNTVRQRGREKC